jgi:hypothetical protein
MSDFDDLCAESFDQAGEVYGLTEVTIGGHTVSGIFDSMSSQKPLDEGGFMPDYDAQFMVKASELDPYFDAPLERSLCNQLLAIGGRNYTIERAVLDEITLTLSLKS